MNLILNVSILYRQRYGCSSVEKLHKFGIDLHDSHILSMQKIMSDAPIIEIHCECEE